MRDHLSKLNFKYDDKGQQAILFFLNGYGVSVVWGEGRYGDGVDSWELAVLKGEMDNWELCYDTDVTCDVMGWLDRSEVNKAIEDVYKLEFVNE